MAALLYACDRCGLVYLTPPADAICTAAHYVTPVYRVASGVTYLCGGTVRAVETQPATS